MPTTDLRHGLAQTFAPAERTLPAMLMRQAERHGDKPLVSACDDTWTYADTAAAAARTAGALHAAGIGPGDRVAILCSNRIELLGLLEPSAKAYACLFRLQRAIDRILAAAGVAPDLNELDVPGDSELR